MNHGILDQEWNDYLDGKVTAEVCYRIDAHCAVCLECSEFREQMSCATQLLTEAANEARRRFTLKEKQIDHLLGGILTRIRTNGFDSEGESRIKGRLDMLETVLAPFCGTQIAARALHSAAAQSSARTLEDINQDNWEPFLERLTDIAAAMCGDTFASLVWERGQLAGCER